MVRTIKGNNDMVTATQNPPKPMQRFYDKAHVKPENGYFRIFLDDKALNTPARRPLLSVNANHAAHLAQEWQDQGDTIDLYSMAHNRLYNAIIDRLLQTSADTARSVLLDLAEQDQLFVFADHPSELHNQQEKLWRPALMWSEQKLGYKPATSKGLTTARQSGQYREAIEAYLMPFPLSTLGAMQELVSLTDSLLLALCYLDNHFDFNYIWQAAHVDEDYQIFYWGDDEEAQMRRQNRRRDALTASEAITCFNLEIQKTTNLERYLLLSTT